MSILKGFCFFMRSAVAYRRGRAADGSDNHSKQRLGGGTLAEKPVDSQIFGVESPFRWSLRWESRGTTELRQT